MSSRWRIFFTTAAAVLALDQLTKLWIVKNLTLTSEIPVISGFFSIVSVRNRGAAFGFLNRSDIDWQFWLFLAATLVAAWAIIMLVRKSGRAPLLWTGLALVMGGAIGNLVDRIRMREVVDFLDFYFRDAHWPAFNIADVGICVGAGLTALAMLLGQDREDNGASAKRRRTHDFSLVARARRSHPHTAQSVESLAPLEPQLQQ